MAKRNTRNTKSSVDSNGPAKSSARATISGPAAPGGPTTDPLAAKVAAVEALARAMPFNKNKALEHGAAAAAPQAGECIEPTGTAATASTLTEENASDKAGAGPRQPGHNPNNGSLDRVRVDSGGRALTTNQGVAVADNQNSLKAGLRGPALLDDFILREKITHFDHERIPERVVHARGSAAHGYFECDESLAEYTCASLFASAGKRTPVFVRFSTVAGERGSADTVRDVRGFAVKFYTDDGNFDIVGNNIPVFFIQDAMKFPDLVHARQAGAALRDAAGVQRARHLLGLRIADAGIDPHADVGHVGPGHPPQLPHDAGVRGAHLPARERRPASRGSSSSTGARWPERTPSTGTRR